MLWIAGAAALVSAGVVCLWWPGRTPAIRDVAGNRTGASIAAMEKVRIGGDKQWVVMRGRDVRSPVLLWLAGGPGRERTRVGEEVQLGTGGPLGVVNWEQRGAGKSWPLMFRKSKLRPEQYVADASS